ncbi:methylmalonyl Co-A mutase-associated GTPase MeaB [Portibacter marinus]|uniref:methylmalonyl Co-A mutase-associated GTPase MeaB n=1 Tax=Portibacter marinus TaxID=2898660 RepID=UPI001F1F2601|nr:methylmalonyl Co-A mutase-associated GTPase MeaB [Portibacter marinus]
MDINLNKNIRSRNRDALPEDTESMKQGIQNKEVAILSRVITLIEHKNLLRNPRLISFLSELPESQTSTRIAITGPPGVGKSTFIEALGLELIHQGFSVAVLAIDPASQRSKGSILGDKTRMEKLSKSSKAFIRPSSNALESGGVRNSLLPTIKICETAKFDFILVETVGVGQSELEVGKMTDIMLLLLNPSGGDELQGIKRGIVEMADLILINKGDGALMEAAESSRRAYANALHFNAEPHHLLGKIEVQVISSITQRGIPELAQKLIEYSKDKKLRIRINKKRKAQEQEWFEKQAKEMLYISLSENKEVSEKIEELSKGGDIYANLSAFDKFINAKFK